VNRYVGGTLPDDIMNQYTFNGQRIWMNTMDLLVRNTDITLMFENRPIKRKIGKDNYMHNILYDVPTRELTSIDKSSTPSSVEDSGAYINDQNSLNNFQFGAKTMDDNGCAVIGTYNALKLLGKLNGMTFQDFVYSMEPYSALFALFGTAPDGIKDYLGTQKISYTSQSGTNDNYVGFVTDSIQGLADGQKAVFIMTFWNTNTVTGGAHTIAFYVNSDGSVVDFNDGRMTGTSYITTKDKDGNDIIGRLDALYGTIANPVTNHAGPINIIYLGRA